MTTLADVTIETRGTVVVAHIDGEIDRSNAREIKEALLRAVPNVAAALVLDLSSVGYIDSSGVQFLFDLHGRLANRQQQLRAVVPEAAKIRRVLSLVAVDATVPLYDTVGQAFAQQPA